MKNYYLKFFGLIILASLFIFSCDKKKETDDYTKSDNENIRNERTEALNADNQSFNETTIKNNLEFLRELDGKYPYEVNLFDNQDFTDRLKNLLGDRYDFLVSTWAVELPIEINGDLFIAEACMAHNCDATNFIICYNFSKDILYVGIREEYNVELFSDDGSSIQRLSDWAK